MALRDLMNNYIYGKQGKADFTVANLPKNRFELFGTVLKVRWAQMIGLNLLYMLIWIPAILWTVVNVLAMLSAEETAATSGLMSSYLLVLAPCVAITGPFNAGATYVLRNWARDEHSFMLSDFKDAVKENWKQALAVSAISGVMPFLLYTAVTFYGGMMASSPVFVLPVALVAMVAFLWSLSTMIMYDMLVTYELKLKDVIRNSVLLTVGKLPFAVAIKLATLVVPALALLVAWFVEGTTGYAVMVASSLYLIFMPTFNKLMTVSYANWLCEKYLNVKIEGARTNIGLRPEDWDDTEYRPEDDEE